VNEIKHSTELGRTSHVERPFETVFPTGEEFHEFRGGIST